MRLKCANLIQRWLPIFVALCCAVALSSRVQQAADDAQTVEDDYRITRLDERQRAVAELRKNADQLRTSGQVIEAVRTLNRVGRFQIRMYVADEAIQTFQQALQLIEQQPDIQTKIDSLNGLASSYDNLSKCDLVEPSVNTAIALSSQTNYPAGKAEALLTLSHCQNHRDHTLAMKSAQESLALWRSIDRKRGIAEAHVAIGEYQMAQNDLVESAKSLQTALSLYRELEAIDQQATILIYLGFLEYRNGAWQDALGFYTQAQSLIDEKAEPYRMAQITGGLGEAFLESGLSNVALAKFRESLEYFRLAKAQRGVRAMIWSIGRAQYMSDNYSDALASLQTARTDAASNNDPTMTAFCDDFLGRTYYAMEDYASALSHFQAALDGYLGAKNTMEAARTRALMAQVYEQQGHFEKARHGYQTALETFQVLTDHVDQAATLYALGRLELNQNRLDAAENYLRQSIDLTENIRRVSTSVDLITAFSATVHDRYEAYVDCLMRRHQASPAQQLDIRAFETSELARGRSLAELLRATQTNLAPGVDVPLAEQEKILRQSLRIKEDDRVTLLSKAYKKEDLEVLQGELAGLTARYKEVMESIHAHYPSYAEISRPVSWTLSQIQQNVITDDETVLLEYSLGTKKSYAWVVTNNSIKSYELPARTQINEAAQKVHGLLTAGRAANENELNRATLKLAEMVLWPVAADLNKRTVIVVADGALNYIPFQMLPTSLDVNEPLVARIEVINALSASILGRLREASTRRQSPTKVLAAFGDPVFASNYAQRKDASNSEYFASAQAQEAERGKHALRDIEPSGDPFDPSALEPLFFSRRELSNLRDVAGPESFVATGFEATREKLSQADLTGYAILHFATHGILDPKNPENSGLFLSMVDREGHAQNGFVGLQDIYRLHAPVDLVVLSACRTGLGKNVRGEGLIGLTRGFMYAGASSVIASLWKVDDEATAELMKRFYSNVLQKGMTPAAALRAAQNSIRQEPQWRSPYFWAAFTLQGEYRQIIKPPSSSARIPRLLVIGVTILLAVIFVWVYRRTRDKVQLVDGQ
ncbi:MAG TPA: CHAT domain-containing protein [Pyrinomonadaceae bacterium]|nr:CHAT domain-containing protein [Pyrinomonadaceae bacterium]